MSDLKIERILVAVADPSAGSNKAVWRARARAHKTGASIELLNAMPTAMSAGIMHAESERFTCLEAEENHRLRRALAVAAPKRQLERRVHRVHGIKITEYVLPERVIGRYG